MVRGREVGWKYEGVFVEYALDDLFPGGDGCLEVVAARQVQFRPSQLNRVVECVPGEVAPPSLRDEVEDGMSDRVARRRLHGQAW